MPLATRWSDDTCRNGSCRAVTLASPLPGQAALARPPAGPGQAATTRPEKSGLPFTHWSLHKLAVFLARNPARIVTIGRERLRQILHARQVSFQRTRTWKESADPDKDARLDAIEQVTSRFPDRCFAFDQFGPLSIRLSHGSAWVRQNKPVRLRATYHRTHGIDPAHLGLGRARIRSQRQQRWGRPRTKAA